MRFLQKFRQRLLTENRVSKYLLYAVGEILLVVIGILIALQINNWNEERILRNKEKAFLAALQLEFLQNRAQLDTVNAYHQRAYQSCQKLIGQFPIDTRTANLDSIGKWLRNIVFTYTFNPSQGTIHAIGNTSSFEVIRNRELREILISWPDQVLDLQEDEIAARTYFGTLIDPYLSRHFDYNFNFADPRNDLKALESLEFEYLIQLRRDFLDDILVSQGEREQVSRNIERVIELTRPGQP